MTEQKYLKVTIDSILRQFNKEIPFLQPLYECIVNSFEAKAKNVYIDFDFEDIHDEKNKLIDKRITGFTIIDDGEGFNQKNKESFLEYLSTNKQDLGCKGVGRFTWLKVFNDINIESYFDSKLTSFVFNRSFSEDSIKTISATSKQKQTKIEFKNVTQEYVSINQEKPKDLRAKANLNELYLDIQNHLLVKLLMLKEQSLNFKIELKLDNKIKNIDSSSLGSLSTTSFAISDTENIGDKKYEFNLYYDFEEDKKSNHKLFYCADGRTVLKFSKHLEFKDLPDKASATMFLTSKYFDERVNNERNKFIFDPSDNNVSNDNPIPLPKINDYLKQKIRDILLTRYPELEEQNKKTIERCIEDHPYLAKYIKKIDKSIIENPKDVIDKATKKYEAEKIKVRKDFGTMLEKADIDSKIFFKNISRVNDISARELAQYFIYREQIIDGLKKLHEIKGSSESDLHNLFMQMGKISNKDEESFSKYDTNVWLLDDKFMSYTNAFSDTKIKKIKEQILSLSEHTEDDNKEPDLAIFYEQVTEDLKDIVVVEFKALDVGVLQKGTALFEIDRNLQAILNDCDGIRRVFGYIITKIDDEFCRALKGQRGVQPLFSRGDTPFFYYYNNNLEDKNNNRVDGHVYIISTETIYKEAESRNKTFLEIIKNT